MSTPHRLPIVNSDDGTWGDIIRQYLLKEHYDDGTDNAAANGGHKTITIRAGTATAGTAPLKFTTGTLLSAAEAGAVEFASDQLYFTISTGTTRKKVAIYDDSGGATGDLYYRDSGGNFVKLSMSATANQVLKSGTTPAWGYTNSGFKVYNPGGNYAITTSDTVVFADATSGNTTINLPASSSTTNGYRFYIKRVDGTSNTVTVARAVGGSDTIDGQTSFTMPLQYMSITVVCDGSNWYIL